MDLQLNSLSNDPRLSPVIDPSAKVVANPDGTGHDYRIGDTEQHQQQELLEYHQVPSHSLRCDIREPHNGTAGPSPALVERSIPVTHDKKCEVLGSPKVYRQWQIDQKSNQSSHAHSLPRYPAMMAAGSPRRMAEAQRSIPAGRTRCTPWLALVVARPAHPLPIFVPVVGARYRMSQHREPQQQRESSSSFHARILSALAAAVTKFSPTPFRFGNA